MKRATILMALIGLTFAAGWAQAQPRSGMLLGVYAFPNWRGLRVVSTIPGYSAHGRLFSGDVLLRVTADGITVYPTRNHWEIEWAKDRIGPYRPAALEVYRPGIGLVYFWVEFRPIGGAVEYRMGEPARMEARILSETERPGARALFDREAGPTEPLPMPPRDDAPRPSPDSDPASLFRP